MYNMHSREKNYASHAEILMVLHTCIKKSNVTGNAFIVYIA